jgi:uncharacterized membrane protein
MEYGYTKSAIIAITGIFVYFTAANSSNEICPLLLLL